MSCKFGPRQIWDLKPIVFVVCRYMILNKFTYVCPSSISWIGTAPTLPRTAGPHGQPPTSCKKKNSSTYLKSFWSAFICNKSGSNIFADWDQKNSKGKEPPIFKNTFFHWTISSCPNRHSFKETRRPPTRDYRFGTGTKMILSYP